MGWFKKKSDPISERARALTDQIAQLEAQIRDLSAQPEADASSAHASIDADPEIHDPAPPPEAAPAPIPAAPPPPKPKWPEARLRSTAFPLGTHVPATVPPHPSMSNPVFEEVGPNPFRGSGEQVSPTQELDVRKSDWAAGWRRFKNHFRSPATSNPKLVHYLAANIQGLRPLRYEKRVARNRFILLVVVLVLVVWGVITLFLRL